MSKFCTKCGKQLSDDSLFCSACGSKQDEVVTNPQEVELEIITPQTPQPKNVVQQSNSVQYETTQTNFSPQNNKSSKLFSNSPYSTPTIVKQFLLCLLSLVMLITVFLPVKTISAEYNDEEINVGITPIDSIVFLFDSFSSLSSNEIQDSNLYDSMLDDVEELQDILSDNDNELNAESRALFSKAVKKFARLAMMSEDFQTTVILVVMGILSVVYIVFSVLFLLYSVLKLLGILNIIKNKVYPKTYGFAGIMFAIFIGLQTAFSIDSASFINNSSLNNVEMITGFGTTLGIIAYSVIFTLLIAISCFWQKSLKGFNPVKDILVAVASILIIVLSLGPVFNAEVKTIFSGNNDKKTAQVEIYNDVYTDMTTTDDLYDLQKTFEDSTKKEVTDYINNRMSSFKWYSARDVRNGKANEIIYPMITSSYFMILGDIGFTISNLSPILITLISVLAAYVLALVLIRFISNENNVGIQKRVNTFTLISIIIYNIINIALLITVNAFFTTYCKNTFTLSLSVGNILTILVAIILKCIDSKRNQQQQ